MRNHNPLLINEPPLQVLPTLAVKVGLSEAILLQQLHYWLGRATIKYMKRDWVWNSVRQWQEQLPFFSEKTIERGLKSLRDKEIVDALPLSTNKMDKRLYYTINYEKLYELLESDDSPKKGNAQRQSDEMHNVNLTASFCQSDGIYSETTPENTFIDYPPTNSVDTTAYTEEDAMCENYTYSGEDEEDYLSWVKSIEESVKTGYCLDTNCDTEGLVGGSSKNISFSEPTPASRSAAQADPFYDGGSFMEDEEGLEEDGELSSTQGVVDTTTYGRLVVGGAATAQEAAHINRFISSNPVAKPAGDAIPLPAPEIAVGLASYEAWPDSKIFAYCTKTYKWDAAWMEALRNYYAKAKANPLRYVRDMCLRRIQLTLELELMGLKDEKPREFKLHHDVTKYDDPERLVMLEAEKKRQAEADARAEEKAKLLFGKGRRIRQ